MIERHDMGMAVRDFYMRALNSGKPAETRRAIRKLEEQSQ